jgi:hypothetical protein
VTREFREINVMDSHDASFFDAPGVAAGVIANATGASIGSLVKALRETRRGTQRKVAVVYGSSRKSQNNFAGTCCISQIQAHCLPIQD